MLCHVIGFTDFDHHGIQGVEASMEEYLHGEDGYRFIEHDRAGQEIVPYRGQERPPRNGYQVHLTVDLSLAEHRRERNRRRDAAIFASKSHHYSDAAADRRNPGDGQSAEFRFEPALRSEA